MYIEARNTWELEKSLRLQADGDNLVIESFAQNMKSKEDVLCPNKRGRRRGIRIASH